MMQQSVLIYHSKIEVGNAKYFGYLFISQIVIIFMMYTIHANQITAHVFLALISSGGRIHDFHKLTNIYNCF